MSKTTITRTVLCCAAVIGLGFAGGCSKNSECSDTGACCKEKAQCSEASAGCCKDKAAAKPASN